VHLATCILGCRSFVCSWRSYFSARLHASVSQGSQHGLTISKKRMEILKDRDPALVLLWLEPKRMERWKREENRISLVGATPRCLK